MHVLLRRIVLATTIFLTGCRAGGAESDLTVVPVLLDGTRPGLQHFGKLEFLGGLRLSGGYVGGLSGMLIEGDQLTALSDNGRWFQLRLDHDSAGRLVGAALLGTGVLKDLAGEFVSGKRAGDAESIAAWAGGILVGFEQDHRLWLYAPDLTATPRPVDAPSGITRLPANGGVEALAALPEGRLLLLAEEGGGTDEFAPGWIGTPGDWMEIRYRRFGAFKPTGAAPLPNGNLVVVERRFSILGGVGARLVELDPAALDVGGAVQGTELGRFEPPMMIDNFEAVAVAIRGGCTVIYLLSDDNFSPLQTTLLFAFGLR